MEKQEQRPMTSPKCKKAFYTFSLISIVLLLLLIANALYAAYGTRYSEYRVTDEGLPEAKGQRYVLPGGAFFDIRDGKIARVTNYYNLGDWIAQVEGNA